MLKGSEDPGEYIVDNLKSVNHASFNRTDRIDDCQILSTKAV